MCILPSARASETTDGILQRGGWHGAGGSFKKDVFFPISGQDAEQRRDAKAF